MTNLEKYNSIFRRAFRKTDEELPGLKYQGIPLWDSIGHMDLMNDLEEAFDIRIDTQDVLDFTSYEKGKEVLGRYGIAVE
ncbi:MAG: acyl carrier protein [Clostridiales bacterium]|nr:acyl carrier protein [Clostridiales bacterium]MCD8370508.1 acyl carrier protein [Clostridiales bacterium]